MQVDSNKTRPKSLWAHLYQQVQEQSQFCDVTVVVNSWKRKYHWCVLSSSSFFAKLYDSKLQEHQTGLIQFSIGTSNSVEAAINFLYGQRPKITTDNVESLLEVAEFLMIEELKARCIKKLKSLKVDSSNCLKLLFLTSQYDFYLETLSNFVLSHLQDLLPNDEMLLLDKNSVRYIITDPFLSYVSREDCLKYLIRWTSHSTERCSDFAELWGCLETEDISPNVLADVSLDRLSESNRALCNSLSTSSDMQRNVIIAYPPTYVNGKYLLYVYCTDNKAWYQLVGGNSRDWPTRPGLRLLNQNIIVNTSYREKITYHNLHTGNTDEKIVSVDLETAEEHTTFDQVFATEDKVFSIKNKVCYTEHGTSDTEEDEIEIDLIDFIRVQAMCGGNEQLAYSLIAAGQQKRRQMHDTCTLFMSEGDHHDQDDTITFKPLISLKGTVETFCEHEGIVYLLIPERKHMLAFSYEQQCVKKLDLASYVLSDKSYICPCSYGGVYLVTKSHILQIDTQLSTSNIAANILSEFPIPNQDEVSDFWRTNYPIKFEALQDKIVIIEKSRDHYENKISYQNLPETIISLHKEEKIEIDVPERMRHEVVHFLQTRLPKEKLRCPIDCPHCQYKETKGIHYSAYVRDSDSDEYIYLDDSDGYYGYYDSSD